jgi:transposase
MFILGHYAVERRTKSKAALTIVSVRSLHAGYSPRMCCLCGVVRLVGRAKVFRCHHFLRSIDRDVNVARNIRLFPVKIFGILLEDVT